MQLSEYINIEQYSLPGKLKNQYFLDLMVQLHHHHYAHSAEYKKISDVIFPSSEKIQSIENIPFVPVSLFKNHSLKSIADDKVYKVLTSSGTTGSTPSLIYLDAGASRLQTLALSKIITHILSKERLPMLIVDSKSVISDRQSFSARGAGILGLSVFGKNHFYLLDDTFEIDYKGLADFLSKYNGQRMLIFGFTFMVWQYLFLSDMREKIDLSKSVLIHSGGWKKLQEIAVDNTVFKKSLNEKSGIKEIYNFYGMIEQIGSVFLENSDGYLHCPNFSDIIIRNPKNFSVQKNGEAGLIQALSVLPQSYPGHSILTEDIGVCMGEDDASNGWKGKYFKILGRAKKAELRGCSDTFVKK
ncbi:MAG: acyl-protein synthetase [Bacteroidetes bacterium]|nr:acyl-protein synthetase [Bacteroidota bacterium]